MKLLCSLVPRKSRDLFEKEGNDGPLKQKVLSKKVKAKKWGDIFSRGVFVCGAMDVKKIERKQNYLSCGKEG